MIENDDQLSFSCEWIGKMYRQHQRALIEPSWDESMRLSQADDIEAQRRTIEREVWEYLKSKYESSPVTDPSPVPKM